MCGIVGFCHAARAAHTFPETICHMLSMIRHRGPDEMGYYFDEQVALGTARLSVIDLSTGQQPLSDASGRYWITYNGEVYNYLELRKTLEAHGHQFITNSDTEVVLNAYIAWGENAFEKLNGGFAFAIYDQQEGTLVLVRDRYGKRPLYYAHCNNEWIFASEIKCFLGHGGIKLAFDEAQLASILTLWTPLPHESGYQEIHQVPVGGYVRIEQSGAAQSKEYYTLNFRPATCCASEEDGGAQQLAMQDAIERTHAELAESVRLRLRSDVEVGTYLSGGLDSAITTLLAVQHSPHRVRTFSVSFDEASYDESDEQELVSRHLETAHTRLRVSNQDIANAFPHALWHAEVPIFRTAFVPMYLLSQSVQAAGIKVVLTGEGSDESFLGYDIFKETLLRLQWPHLTDAAEKQTRLARLYPYLAHFQRNSAQLVSVFDQFIQEQTSGLFSHEIRFSNSRFGLRLLNSPTDQGLGPLRRLLEDHDAEFSQLSPLERAQWLEFKTLLAGYLLSSQGDRMSFAHGVETRMPFLDPNVVHWAWSLPTGLKLNDDNDEKYILKQTFAEKLPQAILQRAKQPYRAPDAAAFLQEQPPDYLEAILSEQELKKLGFVNLDFAQRLVQKVRRTSPERISQRENQAFVFLLSLALLHRQMIVQPPAKPCASSIEDILVRRIDGRSYSPSDSHSSGRIAGNVNSQEEVRVL
ncbi:MAG: asparagine synthase (glutamine-hydrolyzing) [Chloroflexota bacterium]